MIIRSPSILDGCRSAPAFAGIFISGASRRSAGTTHRWNKDTGWPAKVEGAAEFAYVSIQYLQGQMMRKYLTTLSLADSTTILFLSLLSVVALVFAPRIPEWWWIVAANTTLSALVLWFAYQSASGSSAFVRFFHDWYSVPLIFYVFKLTYLMIHPIHPRDYDWLFVAVDRWLFGVDPTRWLADMSHPLLTEILQLAYSSYYFILLAVLFELYRGKRRPEFQHALFLMVFGIYLSFGGYFVLPGVGPRFTLHDFSLLEADLPGIFLTAPLREILNAGESIPSGASNAIDVAQRDIFPSGHVQLTLVALSLAFRYALRSRWPLFVCGALLIVATVYLRYHYVIDVIAGVIFFFFTVWSGNSIGRWWRKRGREGPPVVTSSNQSRLSEASAGTA